jgi:type IV pilus assembly protein PilW
MSMLNLHKNRSGLSLIELLVALAVCGVLTMVIYPYVVNQKNTYKTQVYLTDLQQDVRSAMDLMARETRMAGYDPAETGLTGVLYNSDTLIIQADLNGNGSLNDSNENIRYSLDTLQRRIIRTTSAGSAGLIDNVQSLGIAFKDSTGAAVTSAAHQADIRQIEITITGRTAKPDPKYKANNGYRTQTLKSLIVPKNLSL